MNRKSELLAPAGTLKTLKAVIHAGADAVYFGGSQFGARAYAGNFKKEEVLEAIDFAHIHGRKLFLTVNTLLKEEELEEQLYEYLLPYYENGLDAVIVQDFGVMQFIREQFPKLSIHTSTQMTVTGAEGARFLAEKGASRIVTARELSLAEIKKIHEEVPQVEIESFIHGALCYCYSGQCLLSSMLGGRSGNRGRCAQPCRLPYDVLNGKQKKINDEAHSYPLSPKDLCTIELLPRLAASGVYSFKIEGRMKQPEYAAGVVSIYRKAIDMYLKNGEKGYKILKEDLTNLSDLGNRSGFTSGYYTKQNGADMITFGKPNHAKSNDALQKQVAENYIEKELKKSVQGYFSMKKDEPISLTLVCDGVSEETPVCEVTVTGAIPQEAQKRPTTKDDIEAKLKKTGATPFAFESLFTEAEDGLFLPIQEINELRRNAFLTLQEKLTEPYRRVCEGKKASEKICKTENTDKISYSASVEQESQLAPVLVSTFIDTVYVDSIAVSRETFSADIKRYSEKIHQSGKRFFFVLPSIFRMYTAEFYKKTLFAEIKNWDKYIDGFLVKSYDALSFLSEQGVPFSKIRTDHTLYAYSNRTKNAFFSCGIEGDTIPLELNKRELKRRNPAKSELILYGYLPLMTSAQCVNKNLCGCDKQKKMLYLKDRYDVKFPVKNNCDECYNTIYNSKPLSLFSVWEELKKEAKIKRFRLSFTIESEQETKRILSLFEKVQNGENSEKLKDFTYGHYKRGVE